MCTALLLNEIYLPMKFHVDALHSFQVILRTKKELTDRLTDRRTDGLTDGRVDYNMPPVGGIKKSFFILFHNLEFEGSWKKYFFSFFIFFLIIHKQIFKKPKRFTNSIPRISSWSPELSAFLLVGVSFLLWGRKWHVMINISSDCTNTCRLIIHCKIIALHYL